MPNIERITASVKVRIVKPLDRDWDAVGPRLRELAWLGHRVLNGTMTRLAMSAELPDQVPDQWKSKRNENSEKRPGGKLSPYQMAACAIDQANNERVKTRVCAWCAGSGLEPSTTPLDKRGREIKTTKAQLTRERSAGQVCSRCDGVREYKIGEAVEVPSAIQNGWQRMAERRHTSDRADVLRGAKSIASYRSPAPIAIVSSGEPFKLRRDERGYALEIPLYAGGAAGRVPFAIVPDGRNAQAYMRRMLEADSKLGDLKIISAGKKWIAVIAYSWERSVPEPRSGPDALIRVGAGGSVEFVMPKVLKRLYEGMSITRKRAQFSARRSSRSKHQRDIASGARGHGRARALEHYHAVDDAERRWVKSLCQQIAAKAVCHASRQGARWVRLDESFTLLPPATLRECLSWALRKAEFVEPANQDLSASERNQASGEGGA